MRTLITIRPLYGDPYPVVVEDGQFADPDGAIDRELETRWWWAVPGLADCHAHLAADRVPDMIEQQGTEITEIRRRAAEQVHGGVLLIFDKGAKDDGVLELRRSPPPMAPVIRAAGRMITAPGGYYPKFALEVTADELADAVTAATDGADWVKIVGDWPRPGQGAVTNFDLDTLRAAAKAAHAAGARIAIHTTAPATADLAVEAGFDSIEHGLYLSEASLHELGARGGAWVPTVKAMEDVVDLLGAESSGGMLFRRGLGNVRDLLPMASAAGVAVLAGSDLALDHGTVALEALRLHEYGLDVEAAIDAVTVNAYRYAGLPDALEVGDPADVVFFDRDPLEDLAALTDPAMIIRAGTVISRR